MQMHSRLKLPLALSTLAIATLTLATDAANGQTPANNPVAATQGPVLELSVEAARTAIASCLARDQRIGVTIIDAAGVIKVVLAADGVSARGVTSSTNKALTALHFKTSTSTLAEQSKADTSLAEAITANPNFNNRAGGILIKTDGEIVGAIGVGGARGSEIDEACAIAALDKLQGRTRQSP